MTYLNEDLERNLATLSDNREKLIMDTFGINIHHYWMHLHEQGSGIKKRLKCEESNRKLQYGRVGKAQYFDPDEKYIDGVLGRLYWRYAPLARSVSLFFPGSFSKEFVVFLEYVYTMYSWRMNIPVDNGEEFIFKYSCGEAVFTIDDIPDIIRLRSAYYIFNRREYNEMKTLANALRIPVITAQQNGICNY